MTVVTGLPLLLIHVTKSDEVQQMQQRSEQAQCLELIMTMTFAEFDDKNNESEKKQLVR